MGGRSEGRCTDTDTGVENSTRSHKIRADTTTPIPLRRYHYADASCKICVYDNFVKFVFVLQ